MSLDLKIHHIGCVVSDIQGSLKTYKDLLGFQKSSEVFHVSSQQVNVCFIELGNGTHMELVEPLDENTAVGKLLKNRHSYYHVGYFVDNFEETLSTLTEEGAILLTQFKSEAFDNKRCAFLYTRNELHMIEIIEKPH